MATSKHVLKILTIILAILAICLPLVHGAEISVSADSIDFGELKQHVSIIMAKLDHKLLYELDDFNDDYPPSSENIAHYITKTLQSMIDRSDIKVTQVTAWESENACATYFTP